MPGCSVVTYKSRLKTGKYIFNARVEETITRINWNTSLVLSAIPFSRFITPTSIVEVFTPWVSEQYKSFASAELLGF